MTASVAWAQTSPTIGTFVTCEGTNAPRHTVVKGDTLTKISRQYYGNREYFAELIREVNKIPVNGSIKPGQILVIPTCMNGLEPLPVKPKSVLKISAPQGTREATSPPAIVQDKPAVAGDGRTETPTITNSNVIILYLPPTQTAANKQEEAKETGATRALPSAPGEITVAGTPGNVRTAEPAEAKVNRWGFTGGGGIKYDSIPANGIVNRIADRIVCIDGVMFDFGVAHGKQGSSIWRITFAGKTISDGSFTQENPNLRTTVNNGRIWGGEIERDFRIPVRKSWKVQPMISANLGIGVVTGDTARHFGVNGRFVSSRDGEAKDLFGKSVIPLFGAGVGVIGDAGRHFTWSITAAGIEYPGRYYGKVAVTYWP